MTLFPDQIQPDKATKPLFYVFLLASQPCDESHFISDVIIYYVLTSKKQV